jgi:ribonucleoside-triphosphate reductase (thioredoxin)
VSRYFDHFEWFLEDNNNFVMGKSLRDELEEAILGLRVMPSMRALMTAGPALKRDPGAGFNCAYIAINNLRDFSEALYILMLGCGLGFSVETAEVSQLPCLPDEFYETETTVVFEDSKLGWAKGLNEWLSLLAAGQLPKYNVSKIRPKGARLKTFGGRASGGEVLVDLLEFTKNIFKKAEGRKLTSLECHDIVCKIADIVICGGVRRSATISLSDLNDNRMREAKTGAWWQATPYRRLANNSAVYEEEPDIGTFMKEWVSLYESKSGERGIFSRKAAKHVIENANKFRRETFGEKIRTRNSDFKIGVNPCCEILLRDAETCNLTSVQVRETDTLKTLKEKVRVATILGTFQACLTNYKYVNKRWQKNCEDERLLGVSLNGIFDNVLMNGRDGKDKLKNALIELKKVAIATNIEYAAKLGINVSVAITTVKPEGTTSALNGTSSGIHPAHAPYYYRHVRNDIKDPATQFMIDMEIPHEKDHYDPVNMVCFKFPMKSAKNAVFRKDLSPTDHLELWKLYQEFWAEHKPSVTISVKESEWLDVGAWVFANFEWMSGVSFLPYSDHVYTQAPFEECTKAQYDELLAQMPSHIDWEKLVNYEKEDATTSSQELACTASPEGCFV